MEADDYIKGADKFPLDQNRWGFAYITPNILKCRPSKMCNKRNYIKSKCTMFTSSWCRNR